MTVPMVAVGTGRVLEAALASGVMATIDDLTVPASAVDAASFEQNVATIASDR